MDKKELNKELINCLSKSSNLQCEIRELYQDIEELNAELYKKISRVVEARLELENLAEKYIEILKQKNFLE
jgi:regulator of replication initiation timing